MHASTIRRRVVHALGLGNGPDVPWPPTVPARDDVAIDGLRADGGERPRDESLRAESVAGDASSPEVSVNRQDDGTVFEGGRSNRVRLVVSASEPVLVRDRVPADWTVAATEDSTVVEVESERFVEFAVVGDDEYASVTDGECTYVAEAPVDPADTGLCEFGPLEYSVDGEAWTTIGGSSTAIVVDGRYADLDS